MEQSILRILEELHPEIDVGSCERLVDDGVLDSMDIVTLVSELNAAFGVRIPAAEILPDRFNSVRALADMLRRLDDI